MRPIYIIILTLLATFDGLAQPVAPQNASSNNGSPEASTKAGNDSNDVTDIPFIDLRLFSDFVGLDAKKPNGLIQTEFSDSIILDLFMLYSQRKRHRQTKLDSLRKVGNLTTSNRETEVIDSTRRWTFFHNIYPILIVSKFDNKNRVLPVQYDEVQQVKYLNVIPLMQYANILTEGMLSFVYFTNKEKGIRVYLDGLYRMFFTDASYERQVDGATRKDTFNIITAGWGLNATFLITPKRYNDKLTFEFSFPLLLDVDVYNNDFKASFGPHSQLAESQAHYDGNRKGARGWVFSPKFEIVYRKRYDRFFFKTTITENNRNNVFTRLQVGYSRILRI